MGGSPVMVLLFLHISHLQRQDLEVEMNDPWSLATQSQNMGKFVFVCYILPYLYLL